MKRTQIILIITLLGLLGGIHHAAAIGTAFTYQGELGDSLGPVSGNYDLTFTVYDAATAGNQVGSPQSLSAVAVNGGLFIVTLDFGGGIFTGPNRWLGIGVRPHGGGAYTTLSPRQPLTPAPYAITAGNLSGTLPASQITGTVGNGQLANNSVTVNAGTGLTGGGTVSLGGSTTLNNPGVLSVSGNADITVSTVSGAVTLGTTASSADTPGTLIKRDSNGDFSARILTLDQNLNLPATTSSAGSIYVGGTWMLHAYGSHNSFVGPSAGNFSMTGYNNTANGASALEPNTTGSFNTANGAYALFFNTTGSYNTANGGGALEFNTSGSYNTANGGEALNLNKSGSYNTANGYSALSSNTTGHDNIALGHQAGDNLTTGSYNIDIGNRGVTGDDNTIRIGDNQTRTFIAGNVTVSGNPSGDALMSTSGTGNAVSGICQTSASSGVYGLNQFGGWGVAGRATGAGIGVLGDNADSSGYAGLFNGKVNIVGSRTSTYSQYNFPIAYVENTATSADAGPALRVIGNGGSASDFGALCVSQQGAGNICVFGNSSSWVASLGNDGTFYGKGFALTSDRNAKEHFKPLDSQAVLEKVAALPVTEWNYKDDPAGTRHIGPVAQDFLAAFGLGADDKHISVVDEGGVALAAIQGLSQRFEGELRHRDAENAQLKGEIAALKVLVEKLTRSIGGGHQ